MWNEGDWPVRTNVSGKLSGWSLPPLVKNISGSGPFITAPDEIGFAPETSIPLHFTYWRFPDPEAYVVSPPSHPYTLRLKPSWLNLTALDGNYASEPQTFVARRQTNTLFTYSVDMEYTPQTENEEAGVTVFLTQNHHIRMGVTMLASANTSELLPHFSFYAISSLPVPDPIVTLVPNDWRNEVLSMEIKAFNSTHYSFSAGPAGSRSRMQTIAYAPASIVSWGFTGTLLGIYASRNGGNGSTEAYFSSWRYISQGQFRD